MVLLLIPVRSYLTPVNITAVPIPLGRSLFVSSPRLCRMVFLVDPILQVIITSSLHGWPVSVTLHASSLWLASCPVYNYACKSVKRSSLSFDACAMFAKCAWVVEFRVLRSSSTGMGGCSVTFHDGSLEMCHVSPGFLIITPSLGPSIPSLHFTSITLKHKSEMEKVLCIRNPQLGTALRYATPNTYLISTTL